MRSEELEGWLVDRGYKEDFVREQIERASDLDRAALYDQESSRSSEEKDHIPLVVTFHPALSELGAVFWRLHTMLDASEEHSKVFMEQPLVVFRRGSSLKDNLVRAKRPKPR